MQRIAPAVCKWSADDQFNFLVLHCSLPDDWKNLLKVQLHACMDRKLWKDQADSTDEEWAERQRVFVRRLSNKRNTGPGPNRLEGLNMYEVRTPTICCCFVVNKAVVPDMFVLRTEILWQRWGSGLSRP